VSLYGEVMNGEGLQVVGPLSDPTNSEDIMKFSNIKTNKTMEQDGVWVQYEGNIRLKLCRLNNPAARAYSEDLRRPHARELKKVRDLNNPVLRELMRRVAARHVLVGWENIQDDNGKEILYSEEQALIFFEEDDFFNDVIELASDRDLFRAEEIEADSGNLSKPLSGTSSGATSKTS